jgi:protein-tyrosine phosphatase
MGRYRRYLRRGRSGARAPTGIRCTPSGRVKPHPAPLITASATRTAGERVAQPDRLPPGSAYAIADVLGDSGRMTPADFGPIFEDPAAAERALGGGRAAMFFVDAYREFVNLGSARAGYGRLFSDLAAGAAMPALFHCTTGKDRTGWAAAALLLFLGVPAAAVMEDYLASGPRLRPMAEPFFEAFAARGGNLELLEPLMDVRPAYLESALDEMTRLYGTVEGYFADGLDLEVAARDALRARFVERA